MSGFNDMLARDAALVFANPNEFGESVVYVKQDGTTRNINAVVIRGGLGPVPGYDVGQSPIGEIHVANASPGGISGAEFKQGDRIRVDLNYTGTAQTYALIRPGSDGQSLSDPGMTRYGLR